MHKCRHIRYQRSFEVLMRFKLFIPVLFSGCFFITACSTPYVAANTISFEDYLSQVTFSEDSFTKLKVFNGGFLKQNDNLGLYSTNLRAVKSPSSNEFLFQAFLTNYHYGDWIFYTTAYDDSGTELALNRVSEKVGYCGGGGGSGCSKYETFTLTFTQRYLESKKDSGLNVKVIGNNGSSILRYPPDYIKALLTKVSSMN